MGELVNKVDYNVKPIEHDASTSLIGTDLSLGLLVQVTLAVCNGVHFPNL
jgi:hypothetical protein